MRRPRVLILDDATSAVDPVVEAEILPASRALDTTTLVVAHRVSTIELADRVLFIDAGSIARLGTHERAAVAPTRPTRRIVRAYEAGARREPTTAAAPHARPTTFPGDEQVLLGTDAEGCRTVSAARTSLAEQDRERGARRAR